VSIESTINAADRIAPVPGCLRDRGLVHVLSASLYLFLFMVPIRTSRAQIPPPEPASMAVSIGVTWAIPLADLALQSPGNILLEDPGAGRYATRGTAMTQRIAFALFDPVGVFFQASFPTYGVDAEAIQRDWNVTPKVVDGRIEIVAWSLGIRWRGGGSWQNGPYAEAMAGRYRVRAELEQEGQDPVGEEPTWESGWGLAGGWLLPVGPAFALDLGLAWHGFRVDHFTNRWFGLRILAVMTFGGDR